MFGYYFIVYLMVSHEIIVVQSSLFVRGISILIVNAAIYESREVGGGGRGRGLKLLNNAWSRISV